MKRNIERIEVGEVSWLEITPIQRTDGPPTEKQVSLNDRYHNGLHIGRIAEVDDLIAALNKARDIMETV